MAGCKNHDLEMAAEFLETLASIGSEIDGNGDFFLIWESDWDVGIRRSLLSFMAVD